MAADGKSPPRCRTSVYPWPEKRRCGKPANRSAWSLVLDCGSCIIRRSCKLKLLNFGRGRKIPPPSSLGGEGVRQRGPKDFRLAGNRCSDKLSTLRSRWLRKIDGI